MRFREPKKRNVRKGDFVLFEGKLCEIIEKDQITVTIDVSKTSPCSHISLPYDDVIVLRQNGKYLVGKNMRGYF